jgi:hypothetical protein
LLTQARLSLALIAPYCLIYPTNNFVFSQKMFVKFHESNFHLWFAQTKIKSKDERRLLRDHNINLSDFIRRIMFPFGPIKWCRDSRSKLYKLVCNCKIPIPIPESAMPPNICLNKVLAFSYNITFHFCFEDLTWHSV